MATVCGEWGPVSNPVWHDKRAVPVFPDNNGGEAWPWKPVKIPRDKPSGSKNTVNEKKLTFRLLESQNSHKCCVLISSGRTHHPSPWLRRQFINSRQGAAGVSEERAVPVVRAAPPPAPRNTGPSPCSPRLTEAWGSPLKGFTLTMWPGLLRLNLPPSRHTAFRIWTESLGKDCTALEQEAESLRAGVDGRSPGWGEEEQDESCWGREVCVYDGER